MEDTSRNSNKGEFYTPEHVSDLLFRETNKYIPNFNTTHTIWDNCWGTGNLTKGRDFSKLFCSTLQKMDIRRYKANNPTATKFAYDFLNTDIDQLVSLQEMMFVPQELPEELLAAFNSETNEPLMIYFNPPYVATGIFGANNTDTREGETSTKMKELMRERKLSSACDQAYAQFMYRVYLMKKAFKNKNISIAIICPPLFLTAPTYSEFRQDFLSEFKFEGGCMFKASEFSGLSDAWGISIQVYTPGETVNKKEFKFDLYDTVNGDFVKVGDKLIYNLDGETPGMDWAREGLIPDNVTIAKHTLSSGVKISDKKKVFWDKDSLGYMFFKGNNIYHNEQESGLMSLPYGDGSGLSVTPSNFSKIMAVFCARKAFGRVGANWTNDKDEYRVPDVNSEAYKILEANSVIYAIFNGSSHMSSMNIREEDGTITKVRNNFHHISVEKSKEMFSRHNMEMTGPAELTDSFMIAKLREAFSSGLIVPEAITVWNMADAIWDKTLELREKFNQTYPDYQVCNWDAGWYQVKWVLKEEYPDDFKEFNIAYRKFEDTIRPLIHECGFLKK